MPDLNLTIPGGNASVTDAAITYPFVGSYPTGTTLDGLPYVVAPNGIKINEPTPVSFTDAGRFKNGQWVNPQRTYSGNHPLDSGTGNQTYTSSLAPDLSAVIRPGGAVLKLKSTTALINLGRGGVAEQVSCLFVVSSAPPANAMAPIVWPSADAANRPWRVVDLDGFLALQPNLSTAGQTIVPWSTVGSYFNRLSIGSSITPNDGPGGYEYLSTNGISDDPASTYGRFPTRIVAAALMGLMSAGWSAADKTAAAIRLLQLGCNIGEAAIAANVVVAGNGGGHTHGHYGAMLAWLRATGRQSQYSTWLAPVAGNIHYQYYYVTADMIANDFIYHTNPLKPYTYRGRQVLAVSPDGLTVQVERFITGDGLAQDTHSNGVLMGLNLRRHSDNALAYIPFSRQVGDDIPAGAYHELTLSTPISGLTVGQMVNCVPPFTITAGDAEFTIRPLATHPHLRNPSHLAEYRVLNNFNAIHHLYAHAIGMHGSAMNASRDYTIRAMQANNPTATQDYYTHTDTTDFSGGGNDWAQTFWTAHSATILAMPQIV